MIIINIYSCFNIQDKQQAQANRFFLKTFELGFNEDILETLYS